MPLDQRAPLFPVRHHFAGGPQDTVTRLQASPLRRTVARHLTDHRRQHRSPWPQAQPVEHLRRFAQLADVARIQHPDPRPLVGIHHFDLDRLVAHGAIHQFQHDCA